MVLLHQLHIVHVYCLQGIIRLGIIYLGSAPGQRFFFFSEFTIKLCYTPLMRTWPTAYQNNAVSLPPSLPSTTYRPGVSKMRGMLSSSGSLTISRNVGSPILPCPISSWRSRLQPRPPVDKNQTEEWGPHWSLLCAVSQKADLWSRWPKVNDGFSRATILSKLVKNIYLSIIFKISKWKQS